MHDTLTSANWRDFSQRYGGTYGYVITNGKRTPVKIGEVSQGSVQFHGFNGEEFYAYADKNVTFEFVPLKRRIHVGVDGNLYTIQRRPARQWQRGVSDGNTMIVRLTAEGPMQQLVNNQSMQNMFSEGMPKAGSYKLSDQFGIAGGVVYLYDLAIGGFNNNTITLLKKYEMFTQEIRDAVRDRGYKFEVNYA